LTGKIQKHELNPILLRVSYDRTERPERLYAGHGKLLFGLTKTMAPTPLDSSGEEAQFDDDGSKNDSHYSEENGNDQEASTHDDDDDDNDNDDDDDEDDDDDRPLSSFQSNKQSTSQSNVEMNEKYIDDDDGHDDDDDDSDSDDDVPLSSLAPSNVSLTMKNGITATNGSPSKKAKVNTVQPKKVVKGTKAVKAKQSSKVKDSPTKKTSTSTKAAAAARPVSVTSSSGSAITTTTSISQALYAADCVKGQLIQQLLCRWWYAYTWPDPSKLPTQTPVNYDTLDGFMGVYVCTKGDNVGHILDLRNHDDMVPSFRNFCRKSSLELRDLLVTAITNQKQLLQQHEGSGTATESELNKMLKWAQKVNPEKADKEATNLIKNVKLKLPE
jgi:hypothetical protein